MTRDCSAEKLFSAFNIEMQKLVIPFSNIAALSCDNASVMTGKRVSFSKKLEEKCKHLQTLTCPCHSAALVAHAACAKIPTFCEDFLKKIGTYINSSPKRLGIFQEFSECFQESNHRILKLADTRWLSRHQCISRILEYWDTIKHFLNERVVNEKSKSGEYLLSIMQNVDVKPYFLFLKYILNFFNTFNAYFQAEETRIHLLQSKSVILLTDISRNFLKPEVSRLLPDVTFSLEDNHKLLSDIYLGNECEKYLSDLINTDHVDVIDTIRRNCLKFYITAAEEILKRLPISNIFLQKLKIFRPYTSLFDDNRETTFNDVSFIATTFGDFDQDGLKEEWLQLSADFSSKDKQILSKLKFDEMWKKILQHRNSENVLKYPNLTRLLNAVRSLPNSNADAERIFSFLTDIKTKKRNKLSSVSINAICVLKSALRTRRETALTLKINERHLSLMSSDKLYSAVNKKPKNYLRLYTADDDNIADPSSSKQ